MRGARFPPSTIWLESRQPSGNAAAKAVSPRTDSRKPMNSSRLKLSGYIGAYSGYVRVILGLYWGFIGVYKVYIRVLFGVHVFWGLWCRVEG